MKYQNFIIGYWKGQEHEAFWNKIIAYVNRGAYREAISCARLHALREMRSPFYNLRDRDRHVNSMLGITSCLIAEHVTIEDPCSLIPKSISFKLKSNP